MTDYDLTIGVEADATNAVRDMRAAADAAAGLADSFREIASVATNAARQLNRVEQGVSGTAKSSRAAAQATQQSVKALEQEARAAKGAADALKEANSVRNFGNVYAGNNSNTRVSTPSSGVYVTKQEIESLRASEFAREQVILQHKRLQDATRATVLANIAESKAARDASTANRENADSLLAVQRQQAKRYATVPNASSNVVTSDMRDLVATANGAVRVGSSFGVIEEAAKGAARGTSEMRDTLFTARFALHDISNATGIAGAALVALTAGAIDAAATYESAMASIQRTTGSTASQISVIREQFVALAQSVPGGFDNLAKIGELAGQLNIPTQNIASFTETVAKFTSSTDVAVQASAEAFGRLDTLLPDVQGNYEALGSSILNVGVNSVATESAIISTTSQIAAAGAQARFTADEVIGLAASYASLGIAPEASRGSTIRIFSEIRQAAAEGGAALDEFARISKLSSDEFRAGWLEGDASAVFIEFLKGLQEEGANAETTLRNLGVTGVRDINALLRLSQNVDIVTESFGYASSGFENATQLSEAFGITSQTLNARLEVLAQSFQALLAEIGSAGVGPLKDFVDLLIGAIKVLTDLANNPLAQALALFTGLFAIIAGGSLIVVSLVARIAALNVSLKITQQELIAMSLAGNTASTSMTRLQTSLVGAGISATKFSNIVKAGLVGGAITLGISLLIGGITAIGDAMKSSGEKARDAFGDLSGLTSALQKDTQEVKAGVQDSLGEVEGTITRTVAATKTWVAEVETATGAQTQLASESDRTRQVIDDYTYSIGKNTAAWLANQLANNQAIVDLIKNNEALTRLNPNAPTADVTGVISAAARNDTDKALAIIADYERQVEEFRARQAGKDVTDPGLLQAEAQLIRLKEAFDITTGALSDAAAKGVALETFQNALGVSAENAAVGEDALAESTDVLADRMTELQGQISAALSGFSTFANFGSAIETLFAGIGETGASAFEILGAVGASNLGNLGSAIATTIVAGEAMGLSAVQSVSALFLSLQAQGIETANLLASLANVPGIGESGVEQVSGYLDGTRALTGTGAEFSKMLAEIAARSANAARSVGTKSGGLGNAARSTAKEVRTLTDYAGELEKLFSRAFEIRFSSQQSLDTITSSWLDMREAVDEATKAIEESQRVIAGLTTDNNTLQYFLGVAENYGDALRAAEIASDIADNNAKIAEEQENVDKESRTLNKSLKGNTKVAIENRSAVLGLVQNYQGLIASYASSGLSQQQLAAKTAQLKQEFYQQATALGFSRAELETYALAFDDVAFAIDNIPRNITVDTDINPAVTALRELEARAQEAARSIGSSVGGALGGLGNSWQAGYDYGNLLKIGMDAALRQASVKVIPGGNLRFDTNGKMVEGNIGNLRFFSQGGYTGGVSASDVAGIVHGKEYVINAKNTQRLGLPFLNALNSGMLPSASGSGVSVVELSARDRALLAAAGNVTLSIDGKVIANATNGANFISTKRGAN